MSIEQNWKQFNEEGDDDLSSLLQPGRIQKIQSSDPLLKIKRSLLISIIWAVLIAALYVFVLMRFPYWQVILCIGAVLLFTVWGGFTAYVQYKNIRPFVSGYQSLLAEMEKQYKGIHEWIKLQMKAAIFIYPAAAAGGFMIGGMAGSGKSIEEVFTKPSQIIWLLVVMAILVPCGLYLAKCLLNKSFGRHLVILKKNIDELKEEK